MSSKDDFNDWFYDSINAHLTKASISYGLANFYRRNTCQCMVCQVAIRNKWRKLELEAIKLGMEKQLTARLVACKLLGKQPWEK
jgi:hypothetical protein